MIEHIKTSFDFVRRHKQDYCAPIPTLPGHSLLRKVNERFQPYILDYRDINNVRAIKLSVKREI